MTRVRRYSGAPAPLEGWEIGHGALTAGIQAHSSSILRAPRNSLPAGSSRHGYEFVAPLDSQGHIDVNLWKKHRDKCWVRRFWPGEADHSAIWSTSREAAKARAGFSINDAERAMTTRPAIASAPMSFAPGEYLTLRAARTSGTNTFVIASIVTRRKTRRHATWRNESRTTSGMTTARRGRLAGSRCIIMRWPKTARPGPEHHTRRAKCSVFLKLGVTCFGGPIAHIGYFRDEFVVRRRWLDEHAYADLVGLCQFLPGPASSQVGFAIGLMRAGYRGGLAAWAGFTLPSAVALILFAFGASALGGPIGTGLLHGLKLVAVAIVAQAVWGMARTLCPDRTRASIAAVVALIILLSASSVAQIGAILIGGIAGLWLCRDAPPPPGDPSRCRSRAPPE